MIVSVSKDLLFVFSLILLYSFAHSIAAILIEVALLAISMGARF